MLMLPPNRTVFQTSDKTVILSEAEISAVSADPLGNANTSPKTELSSRPGQRSGEVCGFFTFPTHAKKTRILCDLNPVAWFVTADEIGALRRLAVAFDRNRSDRIIRHLHQLTSTVSRGSRLSGKRLCARPGSKTYGSSQGT
jgi:hypothetical protein